MRSSVDRQPRRASVGPAIVLAILLAIFIAGGVSVRSLIETAFHNADRVRLARALTLLILELQVDEETAIRGYAATGDRKFLLPYEAALPRMASVLPRLRTAVDGLHDGLARTNIDAAAITNATWLGTIARPLLAHPTMRASGRLQERGRLLVDQYRSALASTQTDLSIREISIDRQAIAAINRIFILIGFAIALVAGLAAVYVVGQNRNARRIEAERLRVEAERRASATLHAAYEAEKRIADTLQDAMSQRPLPELARLKFSAMYVPAAIEARVGGDWYDVLEVSRGRAMFAIGDVTGHGLEAAVGMGRARQALIAAALANPEPASILSRVNAELFALRSPLVTAIVGYADPETHEFVYSIAGHPPPIYATPGEIPKFLACGSLPLGAYETPTYRTYRVPVVAGGILVLYTDGATEYSHDVLDGERRFLAAAAFAVESAARDPARTVYDEIFTDGASADDVAIVTVAFADDAARV